MTEHQVTEQRRASRLGSVDGESRGGSSRMRPFAGAQVLPKGRCDLLARPCSDEVARLVIGRPVVRRPLQMLVQLEGHLRPSRDGASG